MYYTILLTQIAREEKFKSTGGVVIIHNFINRNNSRTDPDDIRNRNYIII